MQNSELGNEKLEKRMRENVILSKSFEFSRLIIRFCLSLKEQKHFELSSQVLRSGTSIGANVREAQRAESSKDFRHKLQIALKEADETKYWLELIDSEVVKVNKEIVELNEELIKLLVAIILKSKGQNNS